MKEYDNIIDTFSELRLDDKRKEVMHELQELMVVFQNLNLEKGKKVSPLLHHAMNDIENNNTENEFLNAMYSYIISTKELVGHYLKD